VGVGVRAVGFGAEVAAAVAVGGDAGVEEGGVNGVGFDIGEGARSSGTCE
jgi:hypothetical protein